MPVDFYVKPEVQNELQKANKDSFLEIYHDLDLYLTQLETLFTTKPGEVLGSPDFGLDLEKYVHELNLTERDIDRELRIVCLNWVPLFFSIPTEFKIQFLNDENSYRNICIIEVYIVGQSAFSVFL